MKQLIVDESPSVKPYSTDASVIRVDLLRARLDHMRTEWQEAAQETPLDLMQASVGLMLEDFERIITG